MAGSKIYLDDGFLDNLLNILPVNIYWKDTAGKYLGANANFATIIGFASTQDIIGKTDDELLPENLAPSIKVKDEEIIQTEKTLTFEEVGLDIRGNVAVYLSTKMPLYNEDKQVIGVVGISQDITKRKEAETKEKQAIAAAAEEKVLAQAAIEKERALTILMSSNGHDLRTPIAGIAMEVMQIEKLFSGLEEVWKDSAIAFDKQQSVMATYLKTGKEHINNIKSYIYGMNDFISSGLQSMKRLAANTISAADYEICQIANILSKVLDQYPFPSEGKKLVHTDKMINFSCLAVPVLLYRVFLNLLNNAFEQIQAKGKGEVFISSTISDKTNILRFRDTAGDPPPHILSTMFEGFKTNKEKGTGIGLAFCKLTMQSFSGDITATITEENHMEFILTFPNSNNET